MNKKTFFGFVEPKLIVTLIVSLIFLAAGVSAFFQTIIATDTVQVGYSGSIVWDVTSPTNPVNVTGMPQNTIEIESVIEVYTNGLSSAIDTGNYSWSYSTPTQISVNVTGG